jgi:hypothetical protein
MFMKEPLPEELCKVIKTTDLGNPVNTDLLQSYTFIEASSTDGRCVAVDTCSCPWGSAPLSVLCDQDPPSCTCSHVEPTIIDYSGLNDTLHNRDYDYDWWLDDFTVTIMEFPFDAKIVESTHLGLIGFGGDGDAYLSGDEIGLLMGQDGKPALFPGEDEQIDRVYTLP